MPNFFDFIIHTVEGMKRQDFGQNESTYTGEVDLEGKVCGEGLSIV